MTLPNPTRLKDAESEGFLANLAADEKLRAEKIPNVKTVLVVFSSRAIAYDRAALEKQIHFTYPEAKVYFMTSLGIPVGVKAPDGIDLLIDFTGPRQKHKRFLARRLRSRTKMAIGREAGFFRAYIYDRVVKENWDELPEDLLERERLVQRQVLRMAGIPITSKGELMEDLRKELPEVNAAARRH